MVIPLFNCLCMYEVFLKLSHWNIRNPVHKLLFHINQYLIINNSLFKLQASAKQKSSVTQDQQCCSSLRTAGSHFLPTWQSFSGEQARCGHYEQLLTWICWFISLHSFNVSDLLDLFDAFALKKCVCATSWCNFRITVNLFYSMALERKPAISYWQTIIDH